MLRDHANVAFQTLADARETIQQLRGLHKGQLSIGAASTIGTSLLLQPLGAMKAPFPGIEIALIITNKARIIQRVLNHEVELGFVGPPAEPVELAREEYLLDELVLIMAPTHRLAGKDSVAVKAWPKKFSFCANRVPGLRRSWKKSSRTGESYTIEQANEAFSAAAVRPLEDILGNSDSPLVSSNFRKNSHACVGDGLMTTVIPEEQMIHVVCWYYNEWGYASRVVDVASFVSECEGDAVRPDHVRVVKREQVEKALQSLWL